MCTTRRCRWVAKTGCRCWRRRGRLGSHRLAQTKCMTGAVLEEAEDAETLLESMDLQRCLMMPFASQKVAAQLQQWLGEATRRRNEHFIQRIDETLGEDEVGLLLVNERHQLQFPQDIEVFYVAPPALDEYRRWVQGYVARQRAADRLRLWGRTRGMGRTWRRRSRPGRDRLRV